MLWRERKEKWKKSLNTCRFTEYTHTRAHTGAAQDNFEVSEQQQDSFILLRNLFGKQFKKKIVCIF